MQDFVIFLVALYAVIAAFIAIGVATDSEGPCQSTPNPDGKAASRDFALILLAILAWPLLAALLIVVGVPAMIIEKFLCTPGYTCCGCSCASCAKQTLPQEPQPTGPRSEEHNMEAGLDPAPPTLPVPAPVISVPPPAHTEAMELTPLAKISSAVPAGSPPPYK
jgi:hypothetical protein